MQLTDTRQLFLQAKQEIMDVKQERLTLASEQYKQLTSRLQPQWKASKTSRKLMAAFLNLV